MMNISKKVQKCKICGNLLKSGRIYCSRKCYWKKSPKFKTKCKQCGKEFLTYPSWQKNGQGFLCSKECKYRWIGLNYRGKNSRAGFKNAKKLLKCKECGKGFYTFRSRIQIKRGIFCSKNCYNNWFSKNSSLEKSPAWIDGRTFIKYPKEFELIKNEIKKRDSYICQNCGKKVERRFLTVHHINYDKLDNKETNLITLCTACNSGANGNKDYWIDLFTKKINKILCQK